MHFPVATSFELAHYGSQPFIYSMVFTVGYFSPSRILFHPSCFTLAAAAVEREEDEQQKVAGLRMTSCAGLSLREMIALGERTEGVTCKWH